MSHACADHLRVLQISQVGLERDLLLRKIRCTRPGVCLRTPISREMNCSFNFVDSDAMVDVFLHIYLCMNVGTSPKLYINISSSLKQGHDETLHHFTTKMTHRTFYYSSSRSKRRQQAARVSKRALGNNPMIRCLFLQPLIICNLVNLSIRSFFWKGTEVTKNYN